MTRKQYVVFTLHGSPDPDEGFVMDNLQQTTVNRERIQLGSVNKSYGKTAN